MNFRKLVTDKIEELGLKEAAAFFGKSENAIRTWKTTGNIPLSAVETVMKNTPLNLDNPEHPISIQELPEPVPPVSSGHDAELNEVWNKLQELNKRLGDMENMARSGSGLPARVIQPMHSAVVPPGPPVAVQQVNPPASVPAPQSFAPTPMEAPIHWTRPHPTRR